MNQPCHHVEIPGPYLVFFDGESPRLVQSMEAVAQEHDRARQATGDNVTVRYVPLAQALVAPGLYETLKEIEAYLAEKCDFGVLDRTVEYRHWLKVCAALERAEG